MNVYKFELRSIKKSILISCIILISIYYLLIVGVYTMFEDGMKVIQELIRNMPDEYLLLLGIDINNMVGYNGFYSFSYVYIALVAVLMATNITLSVFGREKKSHSQEFLLTKPVKRKKIFINKLLAVLTGILIFNIILIPISLFCFNKYGNIDQKSILATFAITFSQLIFVGIATFISTFIPKIRTNATIISTVGLLAFTLELFVNALRIKWIKFLSPLHFFNPKNIFENGGYDTSLVMYAIIILVLSILFSARKFIKSDLYKM